MKENEILAELQTMKRCMDKIVTLLNIVESPQTKLTPAKNPACLTDDDEMPFGKYKGQKIKYLPQDYLDWLIGQDKIQGHAGLEAWRKNRVAGLGKQADLQIAKADKQNKDEVPF